MSVVTCHGTQLKMLPNGSATEAAAAQLIGEGTILPLLAAASPVHYWRHAFAQKPHAARRSALCKKAAPWHALTFGSHGDFVKAAIGLCKQAESAGAETCRHLTMSDLPEAWRRRHSVDLSTYGAGHWKWKPFIILQRLKELNDGDLLLYADRDLKLSFNISTLFCLGQNAEQGLAAFHQTCFTDRPWTSHELVNAVGAGAAELDTVQIAASLQVWRRSSATLDLAQTYLDWTERYARDPSNETVERMRNKAYIAHRHDQSCFSLLLKKRGIQTFPWPLKAHDRRDIWAWEAGYCSPSFTFPFAKMPHYLDIDFGPKASSLKKCLQHQGKDIPEMTDYNYVHELASQSSANGTRPERAGGRRMASLLPPPWVDRLFVAKAETWSWPQMPPGGGQTRRGCLVETMNATHYNCDPGSRKHTGKRCVDVSFGKQLISIAARAVTRAKKRGAYPPPHKVSMVSWPASVDLWARHLQCGHMDAWRCMFGRALIDLCCDKCVPRLSHALKAMVLDGNRMSPLLAPGRFWRPAADRSATWMNISVHVRGSDACGWIHEQRINSSNAYLGHSHVRTCISPAIFKQELTRIESIYSVDQIFLATDDEAAERMFAAHPKVRMRRVDRRVFDVHAMRSKQDGKFDQRGPDGWNHWIENRNVTALAGREMVVSALEDFRFLAQGSYVLGSFCSTFTIVVWHLITALDGRPAPFTSVDGCTPVAEPAEASTGGFGRGHYFHALKRQHINGFNRPTFLPKQNTTSAVSSPSPSTATYAGRRMSAEASRPGCFSFCRACTLHTRGDWASLRDSGPHDCQATEADGPLYGFSARDCSLRQFDHDSTCTLLRGKTLMFVGDSLAAQHYGSAARLLRATVGRASKKNQETASACNDTVRLLYVRDDLLIWLPYSHKWLGVANNIRAIDPFLVLGNWHQRASRDADILVLSAQTHFPGFVQGLRNDGPKNNPRWLASMDVGFFLRNFNYSLGRVLAARRAWGHSDATAIVVGPPMPMPACRSYVTPLTIAQAEDARITHSRNDSGWNSLLKRVPNLVVGWDSLHEMNDASRWMVAEAGGSYLEIMPLSLTRPDGARAHMSEEPGYDCLHSCDNGPVKTYTRLLLNLIRDNSHDFRLHKEGHLTLHYRGRLWTGDWKYSWANATTWMANANLIQLEKCASFGNTGVSCAAQGAPHSGASSAVSRSVDLPAGEVWSPTICCAVDVHNDVTQQPWWPWRQGGPKGLWLEQPHVVPQFRAG